MNRSILVTVAALAMLTPLANAGDCAAAEKPLVPEVKDLTKNVPQDFPRFYLAGHDWNAALLNQYYWHHTSTRPANGNTVFNKEYLTIGDSWAAGSIDNIRKIPVQKAHQADLTSVKMDNEGYAYTHQCMAHAHEHGWPFPLWMQCAESYEKMKGKTAGWHFQLTNKIWYLWVWDYNKLWKMTDFFGLPATKKWELSNVKSLGIADDKWRLESTGPSPSITTPADVQIEAFQAPFMQLRWTRTGKAKDTVFPYIEWMREGDESFSSDRRVYILPTDEEYGKITKSMHCQLEMHTHPKWNGKIKRIRISLAPGESDVKFGIDSFFTAYDTRHTINNPILIMSIWNVFKWTGDLEFLRNNLERMRIALRHQQTVMGGMKYSFIRNSWPGHDGIAGFKTNADGSKNFQGGHGIGNNYFDILPFGGDDMYATNQYYAATLVMADIEEAVRKHPEWQMPMGTLVMDPEVLRKHAADVKKTANEKFWDTNKGRFVACIDAEGKSHDYGFTFLNLDSIWYGLASDEHASQIMDWISGKRIVEGDTSTGADIYYWRFAPRCTTLRNVEWYGQCWSRPEDIKWGGQVQDGGAVLGFAFFDLWARLHKIGPDDAWKRLDTILRWEDEVRKEGGYRTYYKNPKHNGTMQGGAAGGLGIDAEFYESIMVPSIVIYGFMGINPKADELSITPNMPSHCPEMGVSNVLYHGGKLDFKISNNSIAIDVKDKPATAIKIALKGNWKMGEKSDSSFEITNAGRYQFTKN